jgi:hypothetical protein
MASPRRLRARLDASRRYKFIKLGPFEPDSSSAYEGIGSAVTADNYYERIGYPELRSKVKVNDVFITVEHCCACATHNGMSLRHDPVKYYKQSTHILRVLAKVHTHTYTQKHTHTTHTQLTHSHTPQLTHNSQTTTHTHIHTTHTTTHTQKVCHGFNINARVGVARLPIQHASRVVSVWCVE